MNRQIAITVCLGLLIVSAFGCARGYDFQYFVLSVEREATAPTAAGTDVLKVRNFRISDRYNRTELSYRSGEVSVETNFYRRFIVPPESLVTEETRRWLQTSHLFSQVLDATSRATASFSLEGNVSALYGDFRPEFVPGPYKAIMEIQFVLIDERKADNTVVFHQSYRSEQPLAHAATDELIQGLNLALKDILTRMEADLKKTLAAAAAK
jgi:cholesterol transport system auxiliary component